MKTIKFYLIFLLLSSQFVSLSASAQTSNPVIIAYITITSSKNGVLNSGATTKGHEGKIECLGFTYGVKSPRDISSGMATGKRVEMPVTIVKHWDRTSALLLQSIYTNETLKSVVIDFYKKSATGEAALYQTIQLTNAAISQVSQYGGLSSPQQMLPGNPPYEEITFTFQKIQVSSKEANTTVGDDAATGTAF